MKGWSLRQLADRAGVAHSFLTNLEEGRKTRPSLEHVGRVATALDRSLEELVGGPIEIVATAPASTEELGEEMDVNLKRIGSLRGELGAESLRKLARVVQAIREEAERDFEEESRARARKEGA
jgi:transcriptional regulator with XRE-family HTH domain